MAYQIEYNHTGSAKYLSKFRCDIKKITVCLMFVGLLLVFIWSLGADWPVTVDALEQLAVNVAQGNSIKEAFSSFCTDILTGAEMG